jgi:hypothetical protein
MLLLCVLLKPWHFIFQTLCEHSANPPVSCDGFDALDGISTHKIGQDKLPPCGLFGLQVFCPFTFGGILVRIFSAIFSNN